MERLNLVGCGIQQLPAGIERLASLKVLDLDENDLEAIPDALYEIESLEALMVAGNPRLPAIQIPAGKLPNLIALHTNDRIEGL